MNITVEVPDEKVNLVVMAGDIPCRWDCADECKFMTEQLWAIMEGWA